MKNHGIQSKIARKTGITRSTVNQLFNGKRRATVEQAALLEPILIEMGYSITRLDMLYNWKKGMPLLEMDHNKENSKSNDLF